MMASKLRLFLVLFAAGAMVAASLAAQTTFPTSSTLPAAIPDNNPAGVTLNVPVSGLTGGVSNVELDITFAPNHTFAGDLIITITAPGAVATADVYRRAPDDSSNLAGPYTFADGGADFAAALAGGTTNFVVPSGTYAPSTTGPTTVNFAAIFNGLTVGAANGTWTVLVSDNANIDTGSVSALAIRITDPTPTAPTITSTAPATASVGVMYTYTVVATGNPAVTFSIAPDPSTIGSGWLTWDGTDTLSGTPAVGDVGNFPTLTITATNGVAPDDTEAINIVVSQPAPEIDVTDPSASAVTSGQSYTVYGLYATGPDISGIFTITNSGTATLNVTAFNVTNTNCTVTVTPASALPWALAMGGGFDTFMVDLAPAAAGAFSGSISIVNDDANENPFVINFTGNTQAINEPEIAIHRLPADTDVANNSTINETNTGLASFSRTFAIRNEGSAMLTLTGAPVVVSAPVNVIVTVTQPPFTTIAGASGDANSEDFILDIAPVAAGAFSFTVTIANDDATENPFVFNYTGHTTTPSGGGGGGGGGDDDGCSTSNGNSSWLVLFAALAGLGFALRLRRSRA
ncbi:MAG: choice-of-anchor D domain-containing protein [Planctomycetes bacterium]|nr:choice-of-anchor D domain-containing protein [Planctomycetota bacterium]